MNDVVVTPLEGVFYTDGGCRSLDPKQPASRGQAGWGLHGYIYQAIEPKVGAGAKKGVPSRSGYDLQGSGKGTITVVQYVDIFVSINEEATNQIAELIAATEGVKLAREMNLASVLIKSDSEYVVKGSTEYLDKWRANQWIRSNRQPVLNVDLWKALDEQLGLYRAQGGRFRAEWVKGHNGDPGNALADRYARRGVLCRQLGRAVEVRRVSDAKGYWKNSQEPHRMLSLPNWYFTTSGDMDTISPDQRSIYYLGDIRDSEEFFGKRISDASFAVLYLKEPEPILKELFSHFENLSRGAMQGLMAADLRAIFNPNIHDALMTHGEQLLIFNRQKQSIEHIDALKDDSEEATVLGHEIRPTRLAYNAIDVMESLEGVLNDYLHPKEGSRVVATDITEVLYERTVNKTKTLVKLLPSITTTTRSIDVDVRFPQGGEAARKKVCLTFGQDLPDRNTLAALAAEGIAVHVVAWPESSVAFRFATVVEVNGDAGIWSGPYANLQLIESSDNL